MKLHLGWYFGGGALVCGAVVAHTLLVAKGHTSFGYERFSDAFVLVVAGALAYFTTRYAKRATQHAPYIVLGVVLVLIVVTHTLRLFLGGLPCE